MHRSRKETLQIESGAFFGDQPDIFLADANSGFPVALPERAHDVIERYCPVGLVAQREIKGKRDQRAFGVVADDRIRGIFVRPIEFVPGIEA